MIKYKVKDAAADLGVSNKEIIEILEKHCGVTKKTMTTLEESELDVIFDVITKKNKVENFDEYFAARNNKLDNESKPQQEDKPAKQNGLRTERFITTAELISPVQELWELPLLRLLTVLLLQPTAVVHTTGARATAAAAAAVTVTM